MTARRLRAAVIGTGFVGPFHVDAVRRGGFAEVVAIAGSDRARTAARAAALGVERALTADEVIADVDIDVVHVCTPNDLHAGLAAAALRSGKHVVVEKPLALTASQGAEIAALGRHVGRHVAVAFTYRGYGMVRRARALVAAGEVGDLRLIHGAYLQDWLAGPDDYNWRLEPERSGASRAVADIGSHWFDTAEFVSGVRVEAVLADAATFIPVRRRPAGGSVAFAAPTGDGEPVAIATEDAATILVRFAGGARGACVISQVSPGRKNAFTLEVSGSRATLDWAQEDPEHLWRRDRAASHLLARGPEDAPAAGGAGIPATPAGHPEGWADALRDVLRPFYAAIAAGEPPPAPGEPAAYPTADDGVRALRFVDAVMTSVRTERWTPVDAG